LRFARHGFPSQHETLCALQCCGGERRIGRASTDRLGRFVQRWLSRNTSFHRSPRPPSTTDPFSAFMGGPSLALLTAADRLRLLRAGEGYGSARLPQNFVGVRNRQQESSAILYNAEVLRVLDFKGLPPRSDKRKLRALDSADSQAPHLARKGICFLCPALCGASEKQRPKPTERSLSHAANQQTTCF
jgi:hypothetical protein